ncbi:SCO family protein [Conexibacter woesei]|uniref:Alkyl hydroperoxide reductase/ Thiol specific antioxidant/ Mal allergen n=1 Tax=Conexibacter woesei (strain DSM 14684 / CCUG 47730 / CIP 108061 / JCM 11494 / NBRC 100937 / ID131577) TaxID=469383 RepID=D3F2N9_CONWI|nr:SCO family protein [Conexibacter woesei]ADB54170.1 alkyl hydroperoxide reductase/ Thiol specific antioxidant/ Mal allergen [Conexibacter woesei DSM 14684]
MSVEPLGRRTLAPLALLLLALVALVGCGSSSGGDDDGSGGPPPSTPSSRFAAAGTLPPVLAERPAPAIRLTDARSGEPFDTASLRGTPYMVTFLFVNCPDVCPLIGQEIREALEQMGGQAERVAVLAVSVDPRGDTAEAARTWLRRQRQPQNFHYLIGSEDELSPVWRAFYAAPQIAGDPESAHTAVVWLIDARGRLAAKVDAGTSFEPADLAKDMRTLLSE